MGAVIVVVVVVVVIVVVRYVHTVGRHHMHSLFFFPKRTTHGTDMTSLSHNNNDSLFCHCIWYYRPWNCHNCNCRFGYCLQLARLCLQDILTSPLFLFLVPVYTVRTYIYIVSIFLLLLLSVWAWRGIFDHLDRRKNIWGFSAAAIHIHT